MDTIEDLGRRAGAAALADAATVADADDGLRRIRDGIGTVLPVPSPTRLSVRRSTIGVVAAAAVVAAVVAGVVATRDDGAQKLGPDPTPSEVPTSTTGQSSVTTPTTIVAPSAPSSAAPLQESIAPPTQATPETTAVASPPETAPGSTSAATVPAPVFGAPSAHTAELVALADALGATRLAVESGDTLSVLHDGQAVDITTARELQWFDGDYVYATDWQTTDRFLVMTPDGSVICAGDGRIHRIRAQPDGGYVATVSRSFDDPIFIGSELEPVPSFAVDCTTGADQPIAPVAWAREAGARETLFVGSRQFMATYDEEGNANVLNERSASINGEDYAGYHAFDAEGTVVAYGDMTTANSPHVSSRVVVRDTVSGMLRWSVELQPVFNRVWVWADRVAVGHPADDGSSDITTVSITTLDLGSGAVIATVPVELAVAFIG